MEVGSQISEFLQRLADFADAFQRKIAWLVIAGLVCSAYFAWRAYSPDAYLWWNILKCGVLLLPALVWFFIWNLLGQMSEVPELAASLASEPDSLLNNLSLDNYKEKIGVRGLFSTLRALRQQEGLEVVLETIGSVTLLANPFFAVFAGIMMAMLMVIIFLAPFVLLF